MPGLHEIQENPFGFPHVCQQTFHEYMPQTMGSYRHPGDGIIFESYV